MARKTQTTRRQGRGSERSASSGSRKSSSGQRSAAAGRGGLPPPALRERPETADERRFSRGRPDQNDRDWRRAEAPGQIPYREERGRAEEYYGRSERENYAGRGDQGRSDWPDREDARSGRNFGPAGGDYARPREPDFRPARGTPPRSSRFAGPRPAEPARPRDERDYRASREENARPWNSLEHQGDFPPARFRDDRREWDERGERRAFDRPDDGYAPPRAAPRPEQNRGFDYPQPDDRYDNRPASREAGIYQNEDDAERYYSGRGRRNAGAEAPVTRQAAAPRRTSSRTRSRK